MAVIVLLAIAGLWWWLGFPLAAMFTLGCGAQLAWDVLCMVNGWGPFKQDQSA